MKKRKFLRAGNAVTVFNANNEEEYEIEQIINHRFVNNNKKVQYEVTWKGYSETSWVDGGSLSQTAPIAIREYQDSLHNNNNNQSKKRKLHFPPIFGEPQLKKIKLF